MFETKESWVWPAPRDPIVHVINCGADPPSVPQEREVAEHRKGGSFTWDPAQVQLYLSESQRGGKYITGDVLHKLFANKPVLNANALHYLSGHPDLIPEEWKQHRVFFWGTIYRYKWSAQPLYVHCLYWSPRLGSCGLQGIWDCAEVCLVNEWDERAPAALRVG